MNINYIDKGGLLYFFTKIKTFLSNTYVEKESGKGLSSNDYTSAEKTKLAGISAGAQVNVIESLSVNGIDATIKSKKATVTIPSGSIDSISVNGTAQTIDSNKNVDIAVPTDNSQLTNGAGFQTASEVNAIVDNKLSSVYIAKGSVAFANLPSLEKAHLGWTYNVTNEFTTTANFVEGEGKKYPAGTNVTIVQSATNTYKYDVLAGFVDTSGLLAESDLVAVTNTEIDAMFS
jgi:hypothetical protein